MAGHLDAGGLAAGTDTSTLSWGRGGHRTAAKLPDLALARFSALVNLVQNSYDREADRHLPDDAQASLLALLNRWRREVEQTGSRFHMIVLYDENRFMDYGQVFRRAGLDVIACAPTRYPAVDTQVPGDHHPNAGIHRLWGCVARALTAEGGKE